MSFLVQPLIALPQTNNLEFLRMNLGEIVKFFVKMAKTMPGDLQECRTRLLNDFYNLNIEMLRRCRNSQSEDAKMLANT
jgi:hypothetical protein